MKMIERLQRQACPDCGSTVFHLSRAHGHSLWRRLTFQRLYRCESCDSLFYRFTNARLLRKKHHASA